MRSNERVGVVQQEDNPSPTDLDVISDAAVFITEQRSLLALVG